MHYVILRDDDTNAFTPVECLERLYRPFLERGLPVNLATIPAVSTSARKADGKPEGFLWNKLSPGPLRADAALPRSSDTALACVPASAPRKAVSVASDTAGMSMPARTSHAPIAENQVLIRYLKENPGFKIIQHGCHHDYLEFDSNDPVEIARRLDSGKRHLLEAGLEPADAFVAPYDRLSRPALREVRARFRVLSTGWYELRRLPFCWWPGYLVKKLRHAPHWKVGRTLLLSHPGCILSCQRAYSTMLGGITYYTQTQQLTVLVTHWWEYFLNGQPNEEFIDLLHETASFLGTHPNVKVISFADLVNSELPLN